MSSNDSLLDNEFFNALTLSPIIDRLWIFYAYNINFEYKKSNLFAILIDNKIFLIVDALSRLRDDMLLINLA